MVSKKKKRPTTLGRHGKQGATKKAGTTNKLHSQQRDATAAVGAAQAAAIDAAEKGADARDQAVAAGAVRAAVRDAVRAKAAVVQRKRSAGAVPPSQPRKKSRPSADPPQATAPAAAAPAAAQPPPGPTPTHTTRVKRGRPSKAPASARTKEQTKLRNRRHLPRGGEISLLVYKGRLN